MSTKRDEFLALVQTGAIVRDVIGTRRIAVAVLYEAQQIPAECITDPLRCAEHWLLYQYETKKWQTETGLQRPEWLPAGWSAYRDDD